MDSTPIIRGIDGDELVTLVLKYYENLSPKYKRSFRWSGSIFPFRQMNERRQSG